MIYDCDFYFGNNITQSQRKMPISVDFTMRTYLIVTRNHTFVIIQ